MHRGIAALIVTIQTCKLGIWIHSWLLPRSFAERIWFRPTFCDIEGVRLKCFSNKGCMLIAPKRQFGGSGKDNIRFKPFVFPPIDIRLGGEAFLWWETCSLYPYAGETAGKEKYTVSLLLNSNLHIIKFVLRPNKRKYISLAREVGLRSNLACQENAMRVIFCEYIEFQTLFYRRMILLTRLYLSIFPLAYHTSLGVNYNLQVNTPNDNTWGIDT